MQSQIVLDQCGVFAVRPDRLIIGPQSVSSLIKARPPPPLSKPGPVFSGILLEAVALSPSAYRNRAPIAPCRDVIPLSY